MLRNDCVSLFELQHSLNLTMHRIYIQYLQQNHPAGDFIPVMIHLMVNDNDVIFRH